MGECWGSFEKKIKIFDDFSKIFGQAPIDDFFFLSVKKQLKTAKSGDFFNFLDFVSFNGDNDGLWWPKVDLKSQNRFLILSETLEAILGPKLMEDSK